MKQVLLFSLLLACISISAQRTPVKKIYAYKQLILQGKKTKDPASKETYKIYIASAGKITITGLWIQNSYHDFTTELIVKKPIALESNTGKKVVVPATKFAVTEIKVKKPVHPSPKPVRELSKLLAANEIIIVYTFNNKEYFITVKKAELLDPLTLM